MKFPNPFLKLKRFSFKRKSISKIQVDRGKAKVPVLIKVVRIVVILALLLIAVVLIYFAIPNIKAINEFKPASFNENSNQLSKDRVNILLIIKDTQKGYEILKSLDLVSFERSTKNITIKAINTKTIIPDSSLGQNVNVENIYQLNKLKGGKDTELMNFFGDFMALKFDYYMVIPMDYFKDSLKVIGNVKFNNEYIAEGFNKGSVSINSDNISVFWGAQFSNDGQRLVDQNKFLQAFFGKIGSIESLYNYSKLSELSSKYIDTNMSLQFFREFLRNTMFNSDKISFGFSPTNLFFNAIEGKYWDKVKFDDFLKNEFSDIKIQREQARVEVQNASGVQGLASRVARFVSNSGSGVTRVGNFGIEVPKTTVYVKDRDKFAETVNFLENLLNDSEFRFESPEKLSTADILIIVKEF